LERRYTMDADEIKEEIAHQRALREEHRKLLRVLERQAAKFGIHVPPYIQIEIDALIEQIQHCEQKIENLGGISYKGNLTKKQYDISSELGMNYTLPISEQLQFNAHESPASIYSSILSDFHTKLMTALVNHPNRNKVVLTIDLWGIFTSIVDTPQDWNEIVIRAVNIKEMLDFGASPKDLYKIADDLQEITRKIDRYTWGKDNHLT
jgi:hypothetical protein